MKFRNINPASAETTTLGAATITRILPENISYNRARVTIINNTGADLRISKGKSCGAGIGILLVSNGVLIDDPIEIYNQPYMYQGEWYGYSAAGGDVDVMEETIQ